MMDSQPTDEHDVTSTTYQIDGLVYDQLRFGPGIEDPWAGRLSPWRRRLEWIVRGSAGGLQPYVEIAEAFRLSGHGREANSILYHGHRLAAAGGRRVLGLVGYGYRPWYGLLVGLLLAAVTTAVISENTDAFVPIASVRAAGTLGNPGADTPLAAHEVARRCGGAEIEYPCLYPFIYAIETVVPIVDLDQRATWRLDPEAASPWLARWMWIASLSGWVVAALMAASLTKTVRGE